eukprot:360264-Chlamydomonas_euryale.AAC.1
MGCEALGAPCTASAPPYFRTSNSDSKGGSNSNRKCDMNTTTMEAAYCTAPPPGRQRTAPPRCRQRTAPPHPHCAGSVPHRHAPTPLPWTPLLLDFNPLAPRPSAFAAPPSNHSADGTPHGGVPYARRASTQSARVAPHSTPVGEAQLVGDRVEQQVPPRGVHL